MSYNLWAPLCRHSVWLAALWMAVPGCDQTTSSGPVAGCPPSTALLQPSHPSLNIGDTLTMHATSWVPRLDCLPPDTTAAGLRWWTNNGVVAIDSMTGHVTALRPGGAAIWLTPVGASDVVLGLTYAGVFYPPSADTVVTLIRNHTGDSAWVVLRDATGAVQRAQTVAARDSTCWVTALSDSLLYSVTIRPPPQPPGSDSSTARWVTPTFAHTWLIAVDSVRTLNATVTVFLGAVSPDPGTGC
jgi:hypothetical protein